MKPRKNERKMSPLFFMRMTANPKALHRERERAALELIEVIAAAAMMMAMTMSLILMSSWGL
jgi:hypothetical protein